MSRKALYVGLLTALMLLPTFMAVLAETSIQHPKVIVYGDVTKDVYIGRSIFEYKDDQGLSSVLPFERQEKNISIAFNNIVLDSPFMNSSIADATETKSNPVTVTKELLASGGVEYVYLKIVNNTALSANTVYYAQEVLEVSDTPTVTNDHFILVTAKVKHTGASHSMWYLQVIFIFKDAGANERELGIVIFGQSGTDLWESTPKYDDYGRDDEYITWQFKIQHMLDATGYSWTLSKLVKVKYKVAFETGDTVDPGTNSAEAYIIHAVVVPSKVYIDDGTIRGLVINGTSGQFRYDGGENINIYGVNATKIVSVTVPFKYEVPFEAEEDGKNLKIQYTWEYTHPKSPTGTGDRLTYANTNITLYGYKDGSAWDKLYVNGVDKLSSIATKKVGSDGSPWTYGLASSLVGGNMYQVIARIEYTADEYDSLTEPPLFWSNPLAWLSYKFWSLVVAIASLFGIGVAWTQRQRRALRRVRAK